MIVLLDGPGADPRFRCARALAARLRAPLPVAGRARLDTCSDPLAPLAAQVAGLGGAGVTVLDGFLLDWAAARPWASAQGTASALNRALAVARLAARQGAVRIVSLPRRLPAVDRAACETLNAAVSRILPTYYDLASWSDLRRLELPRLLAFIREQQGREVPPFPFKAGTGPTRAAAILVGEARPAACWGDLPFGDGRAATWLNRTLLLHGPTDLGHYLLNAAEEPLAELLAVQRRSRGCPVIALGTQATHWLRRVGIRHHRLRHPSHMQRFHSSGAMVWGAKLSQIQANAPLVRGMAT